jgi:hypothetical protein
MYKMGKTKVVKHIPGWMDGCKSCLRVAYNNKKVV